MSVYNGELYLNKCIDSVLNQTFIDFEFIIIDDGSNDNSVKIIEKFSKIDKRIRLVKNSNKGLTKSLIEAIELSKFELIARTDADDMMHKDRLLLQYNFLQANEKFALIFTGLDIINNNDQIIKSINYNNKIYLSSKIVKKRILFSNYIAHGSVMFRKKIYNQVGGYCDFFKYSQDYDLWLRFLKKNEIYFLSKSLYYLRHHTDSISVLKYNEQLEFSALAQYRNKFNLNCFEIAKTKKLVLKKISFYKIIFKLALIGQDLKLMKSYLKHLGFKYSLFYYLILIKKKLNEF